MNGYPYFFNPDDLTEEQVNQYIEASKEYDKALLNAIHAGDHEDLQRLIVNNWDKHDFFLRAYDIADSGNYKQCVETYYRVFNAIRDNSPKYDPHSIEADTGKCIRTAFACAKSDDITLYSCGDADGSIRVADQATHTIDEIEGQRMADNRYVNVISQGAFDGVRDLKSAVFGKDSVEVELDDVLVSVVSQLKEKYKDLDPFDEVKFDKDFQRAFHSYIEGRQQLESPVKAHLVDSARRDHSKIAKAPEKAKNREVIDI